MTPDELCIVCALETGGFLRAPQQRQFVRHLYANPDEPLTAKQHIYLWNLAWIWRDRLPRELVELACASMSRCVLTAGR